MRKVLAAGLAGLVSCVLLAPLFSQGPLALETHVTEIGRFPLIYTLEWITPRRAHVLASITIPASKERVWSICTDYDHLSEFIPNVAFSRVIKREGHLIFLRQEGGIQFPFYRRALTVTFRVKEIPAQKVYFESTEGDFVIYQGHWRLEAHQGGTLIFYEATIEPNFWMPKWVMNELERQTLKNTFRAIIRRCLA